MLIKNIFREALPEMIGGLMLTILIFSFSELIKLSIIYKISIILFIIIALTISTIFFYKKRRVNRKIGEIIGFINKSYHVEILMNIDGSFKYIVNYELEVLRDNLGSRAEILSLSGNTSFEDMKVLVSSTNKKYKVHHEIVSSGNQYFSVLIKFSPALKRGDIIKYTISYESKMGFITTYEEVVKQINSKIWPMSEPYEFTGIGVKYPTEKLKLELVLPLGYKIYGKDNWDIGLYGDHERIPLLYERLSKENAFKKFVNKDGLITLSIEDNNPTIGTFYILKFIPPSKKEYKKMFKALTNKN